MTTEEKTIEHARLGLSNVQNTVAFIDKKVAAGITVASMIIGFAFPKEFVCSAITSSLAKVCEIDWSVVIVLLCCVIGCVSIVFVAIHAYKVIFSRSPSLNREWVLFPYTESKVEESCTLYKTLDSKLSTAGMSDAEILGEFRDQLTILGGIQAKKMIHCKATFKWLGCFMVSLLVLLLVSFVVNKSIPM